MTLLMGAFLSGFLAAMALSFLAFACVLVATILLGSVLVGFRDGASFQMIVSAFILLLSGQLGFGSALLARAFILGMHRRRLNIGEGSATGARPLWSKRRDRVT